MTMIKTAIVSLASAAKDTLRVSRDLYMIMIPVIILVKILQDFGLIEYAAMPLQPLMELVGLPPEMGLAWAAALLNNMYSGIIVFLQLAQTNPEQITTAQVTTLGGMMLIAHAIPIECGVARKCGTRFFTQVAIRMVSAIIFGYINHMITSKTGYLNEAASIPLPFEGGADATSLSAWSLGQIEKLLSISAIIFVLIVAMNLLRFLGILQFISKALEPMMRLIGVGRKASTITMIGMTLGLSYGSGVIIQEAKKGELTREDIFFSLSFMGIFHSVIEDVLLVVLMGGDMFMVLFARGLICLALIAILLRLVRLMPDHLKSRLLWVPKAPSQAQAQKSTP